jgi:hypothetical protein
MHADHDNATPTQLATLMRNLAHHAEGLRGQQLVLFQSEPGQELGKAARSGAYLGAGAVLAATGGVLSMPVLFQLLEQSTRLPWWACFGLVSGSLVAAGAALLAQGRRTARTVRLDLPQTAQGLKENLSWLKEQLTPAL